MRCRHDLPLLKALLSAPRFASLPLTFYQDCLDPEREMQFSALTVLLDTGEALLVFRGTDNTLVGWKEDFNLSFLEVVPAQSAALNYTARLAAARPGPLLLAGHSKGGNLAVFSASLSPPELRDRIGAVYSYDSPGFTQRVLSATGYQELLPASAAMFPSPLWWGCFWSTRSRIPWSKAATLAFSSMTHTPGRCGEAASSV